MNRQRKNEDHIKKEKLQLNKGIELILSRRKNPSPKVNIISLEFEKLILFFKREVIIHFKFSFDIRKPQV